MCSPFRAGDPNPLHRPSDTPDGLVATAIEIQDLVDAQSALRHLATHDSLTGLLNRSGLAEVLRSLNEDDRPIEVVYIDLDGFKSVNDEFGHVAGDRVLAEIGARLRSVIRREDHAVRIGGDEFILLIDAVTPLPGLVTRIEAALSPPVVLEPDVEVRVGATIGTTAAGAASLDLIGCADRAMYTAKQSKHR